MNRLPAFDRSVYAPLQQRIKGVKRTLPSKRGWGSGWPDCQAGRLKVVAAGGRTFRARAELAALVGFLVGATDQLGYAIRPKTEPDGGFGSFACRPIKRQGEPMPSWHSWGLAFDINTRGNPMFRRPGGFRSTQPPWMIELWESAGFFWGGRWDGSDAMHFEYLFSPADVEIDLANAKAAFKRLKEQLRPDEGLVSTQEDDMPKLKTYLPGFRARVTDPAGPAHVRAAPDPNGSIVRSIPTGQNETWTIVGWAKGKHSQFGDSDQWLMRWNEDHWEYTARGNVPADPTPPGG